MTKTHLGRAALVTLGLGLACLGYVAIFDPYGGHSAAGWVLLGFFLVGVGGVLGLVYGVVRAIARARDGRAG